MQEISLASLLKVFNLWCPSIRLKDRKFKLLFNQAYEPSDGIVGDSKWHKDYGENISAFEGIFYAREVHNRRIGSYILGNGWRTSTLVPSIKIKENRKFELLFSQAYEPSDGIMG